MRFAFIFSFCHIYVYDLLPFSFLEFNWMAEIFWLKHNFYINKEYLEQWRIYTPALLLTIYVESIRTKLLHILFRTKLLLQGSTIEGWKLTCFSTSYFILSFQGLRLSNFTSEPWKTSPFLRFWTTWSSSRESKTNQPENKNSK